MGGTTTSAGNTARISSSRSLLTYRSTLLVIVSRLVLIFLVCSEETATTKNDASVFLPSEWISSPAFASTLIRPKYTMEHVKEAIAIQKLSSSKISDAYNPSQSIQIPPIMLIGFTKFLDYTEGTGSNNINHSELCLKILLLFVDLFIAIMIESIGRSLLLSSSSKTNEEERAEEALVLPEEIQPPNSHIFPINSFNSTTTKLSKSSLLSIESIPLLAAQLYLCSVFVILPSDVYGCYQNLTTLCLVASIWETSRYGGSLSLSTFFLALSAYIDLHYIAFLIPIILFYNKNNRQGGKATSEVSCTSILIIPVLMFSTWFLSLQYLSYKLVGSSPTKFIEVIQTIYGSGWKNMSPNLSVQWYFHMQLFARFRNYFSSLILGLPYVVVLPLAIRLHNYPMELVAIYSLLWTIMRPVEILYDLNVSLCFMLLCPKTLARMGKLSLVALISMWVPIVLYVIDYWMWLEPGTGNANYIFFQCLAYNVFLGIILGQFTSACVQRDKAIRLVRKETMTQQEQPKQTGDE